jgi:hypothetical protein
MPIYIVTIEKVKIILFHYNCIVIRVVVQYFLKYKHLGKDHCQAAAAVFVADVYSFLRWLRNTDYRARKIFVVLSRGLNV